MPEEEQKFDPTKAVEIREEEDELSDELILYQYSVFQEAALEHYGVKKGVQVKDVNVELLG